MFKFNGIVTACLVNLSFCSCLVAKEVPNQVIPAAGKTPAFPFQILTVGESVVSGSAGPFVGFGFSHTVSPFLVLSQVKTDLNPNTLNLKSQGRFVTIFFEITGVKNTGQINPTSLVITRINDQAISPILAEPKPISLEDVDQD
ncbi:MAG: hypothetical protein HY753_08595, partial [Nitrospirae bacterium]|nr:hypothetical protein [Nitrospirota bacterium]